MPGKRIERLQIMLNEEELAAIDDWRFRNRMPSRSAAVRAMLNVAIRTQPAPPPGEEPQGEIAPSKEVGVLQSEAPSGQGTPSARNRRIAVIEPGRVAAAGITALLEDAGHTVVAVLTGLQNWKETSFKNLPDCVVIGDGLKADAATRMADELSAQDIPFIYFKARAGAPTPPRFRDAPAIHAQASADDFNASLESICGL